ncbi:MAG: M14 family metallopeptidase [Tannerellaceae bacterium]|nr:M14 family metallopeptidase [Tannerellaceae bacterium]
MKTKILLITLLHVWLLGPVNGTGTVQAQSSYYFGEQSTFDPGIPTPEDFFGFPIGSTLVRYDKVVEYFKLLDKLSERTTLEVIGRTYEEREHIVLIISTPNNIRNLEQIRQSHLRLVDPQIRVSNYTNEKVVVHLGYNVHGGELAGTDASVLAAYYYAAANDPETLKHLNEVVILIEPSLNPDGRERATTYYNSFRSFPPVTDPLDIEHTGAFAPHRGNHFWTDLNRDWFPAVHVESKARVNFYHKWYPNIYADYHEMGSNSAYYFEPSPPHSTWNPTIPTATYEVLNATLAGYYTKALDKTGSLYYTKEDFDNISPIYGSTYPDFQGGVGTTLEVGSTAGVEIETTTGIRQFSRNLRDNVQTSLAAIEAAYHEKELLLKHQEDFFAGAVALGNKQDYRYFVFGDKTDKNLTNLFLDHLLQHRIEVFELEKTYTQEGKTFEKGAAYVIPVAQGQYRILNAIFEENTQFVDSLFMDITAWSTAHGYGIPFVRTKSNIEKGIQVTTLPSLNGQVTAKSTYAYVFNYSDFYGSKALYYLLDNDVVVKAAHKEFSTDVNGTTYHFGKGAIVIPVEYQKLPADQLYNVLQDAARIAQIEIVGLTTGYSTAGIDLGSNNIRAVKKPSVATFIGNGINWTEVGELWFLLGNRLNIPLTKINIQSADRAALNRYTTIILADGSYESLSPRFVNRLKQWVEEGGTLIAIKRASDWAVKNELINTVAVNKEKEEKASSPVRYDYLSQRENLGSKRIGGALFNADLDITNPLAFGFGNRDLQVIKTGNSILPHPQNEYATVLQLKDTPPVSGYVSKENADKLKNAPFVIFDTKGAGSVILFNESPTFRGYWLSTSRLLTNGIFFGNSLSLYNTRFR